MGEEKNAQKKRGRRREGSTGIHFRKKFAKKTQKKMVA
jgi:hypothetical protein